MTGPAYDSGLEDLKYWLPCFVFLQNVAAVGMYSYSISTVPIVHLSAEFSESSPGAYAYDTHLLEPHFFLK